MLPRSEGIPVSFFLLLMIRVSVKLTAVYIRYLLFSTCQAFASDVLLWTSRWPFADWEHNCQTLDFFFFESAGREFPSGEILLALRGLWCNFICFLESFLTLGVLERRSQAVRLAPGWCHLPEHWWSWSPACGWSQCPRSSCDSLMEQIWVATEHQVCSCVIYLVRHKKRAAWDINLVNLPPCISLNLFKSLGAAVQDWGERSSSPSTTVLL